MFYVGPTVFSTVESQQQSVYVIELICCGKIAKSIQMTMKDGVTKIPTRK